MGEKVIVVLTDEEVSWLAEQDTSRGPLRVKLRAALDRDRHELVEAVAKGICAANDLDDWGWDRDTVTGQLAREQYRKMASGALAAIERADQEEGDRG